MRRTIPILAVTALALMGLSTALADPISAGRPDRGFQVRVGAFMPDGGGDFWDDNEDVFTLNAGDFDDFNLGVTYLYGWSNHLEFGVNLDFFDATVLSEYQAFTDGAGFPIFHDTRLATVPLTADVRFIPGGRFSNRGRGQFETRPMLFVGAGAGINFWEYEEFGDFIDFDDPAQPIVFGVFADRGTAFETHVLAGFEFPISPRVNILGEGRYTWSDDTLNDDFAGLGKIELGGASASVGVSVRF
ncbi:MAG: porin family protein [Acidobacteriota bacterium]|nr:porin family protein [Acidobacteriota bacterium]MDH3784740.1 porin family protein [Acidobacteriota bacterium]